METTIVYCSYIGDASVFVTRGVQFEVSYGTPTVCSATTLRIQFPGIASQCPQINWGKRLLKRSRGRVWDAGTEKPDSKPLWGYIGLVNIPFKEGYRRDYIGLIGDDIGV